jgi:prepilin-type N-terminal cleavage/methylation domain-containing protein
MKYRGYIKNPNKGFTLIELLVVTAIIAILAGLAIPNFLEAQTRSKVSRVKTDLRTIAIGLEAYHAEHNRYPSSTLIRPFLRLIPLSTPVAYITSIPLDIFQPANNGPWYVQQRSHFAYGARPIDQESRWALASHGPDLRPDHEPIEFYPGYADDLWENPSSGFIYIRYDPTNGSVSPGDIWRVSDGNLE